MNSVWGEKQDSLSPPTDLNKSEPQMAEVGVGAGEPELELKAELKARRRADETSAIGAGVIRSVDVHLDEPLTDDEADEVEVEPKFVDEDVELGTPTSADSAAKIVSALVSKPLKGEGKKLDGEDESIMVEQGASSFPGGTSSGEDAAAATHGGGASSVPGGTFSGEDAAAATRGGRQQRGTTTPGAYAITPGGNAVLRRSASPESPDTGPANVEGTAGIATERPSSGEDDLIVTAVNDASTVVIAKDVRKDRSKMMIKIGACLLATAGIVVGVTVGVVVGRKDGGAEAGTASRAHWKECVPPEAGDEPVARSARFGDMMKVVVGDDFYAQSSDGDARAESSLLEPCTPQNRALTWLAEDDGLVLTASSAYWERVVQRYAAATLFFSTDGPNWVEPANWLSGADVCDWQGVSCDDDDDTEARKGSLTSITLTAENGVAGTLPDEVGLLSYLIEMNFADCNVGGTIPTGLFNLRDLKEFFAAGNSVHGMIPWQLFSPDYMPSLARLIVSNNELSGPLPENIGDSFARVLALSRNRLTGPIPSSIVNMPNISHLRLDKNELTGTVPSDLHKLNRTIVFFDVDENKLEGTLPELSSLRWLSCLGISGNAFSGDLPELPECIGRLNIINSTLSGLVKEDVCSHFDQFESVGALICGKVTRTCPCCQACGSETRLQFCAPGSDARMPEKCMRPKPGRKLPPPPSPDDAVVGEGGT